MCDVRRMGGIWGLGPGSGAWRGALGEGGEEEVGGRGGGEAGIGLALTSKPAA